MFTTNIVDNTNMSSNIQFLRCENVIYICVILQFEGCVGGDWQFAGVFSASLWNVACTG